MHRFTARFCLLIFPSLAGTVAWAQAPSPRFATASGRAGNSARPPAGAPQQLFGSIPLSTHSEQARHFLELAVDKYENATYRESAALARRAAEADPQSSLAYAMASFAARRIMPDGVALAKAKSLLTCATPDEQLLAQWMIGIQDRDLLPAIASMNDLLKRFPRDKHVLYMTAEWLLLQQDDDRARSMLESALQSDPAFPAALNRLGYVYMGAGSPDPAKAIASLKRYAEVEPVSPNPQDSLGEISRFAGDDAASLEHYAAALKIDPTFVNSQQGLGGTRTLMGDFSNARKEYARAIQIADNPVDELDAKCQQALVSFWEGHAVDGRKALAALAEQAARKKEPNGQFEIGLASAMLAVDFTAELTQLHALSLFLEKPLAGMSESDRVMNRATVLRERARVASLNGLAENASEAVSQIAGLANSSRDSLVMNTYESARGYLLVLQGDLSTAADELAADPHSPLALEQLAVIQEKLGNAAASQTTRTRLKYQRAPTVEWFLVTHKNSGASR
ncbi:MAG TPA: tetratricopeptide repeat protein [Candidatus Cybelea sp.]|nr:tetratricopeptide repeat protein [Candidatus Cybelea sp.]